MDQKSEFYEKIDAPMPCPYIVKKLPFSKTRQFSHSSFYQQNVLSHKISCNLMWFFQIPRKPPRAHIWSKIKSILSKLKYILGQKSQYDALFSDFEWKNNCSHAYILSKNQPLKNPLFLCLCFIKNRPLFQKHALTMSFFSNFSWKIPSSNAHIWSKKCKFCQNRTIL